MIKILDSIGAEKIQKIYECLEQAVSEDYQEIESKANLVTYNSKSFLVWDLINRNLSNQFLGSNVLYSTAKQCGWQLLLLYDTESGCLFSFMKVRRLSTIINSKKKSKPKYIKALLTLNSSLQADVKQFTLFDMEDSRFDDNQVKKLLNNLCKNFPISTNMIKNHVVVAFSELYGQIIKFNAYVLDGNLDVIDEANWLNICKPVLTNKTEVVLNEEEINQTIRVELTDKAKLRGNQKRKRIVELNSNDKKEDKIKMEE